MKTTTCLQHFFKNFYLLFFCVLIINSRSGTKDPSRKMQLHRQNAFKLVSSKKKMLGRGRAINARACARKTRPSEFLIKDFARTVLRMKFFGPTTRKRLKNAFFTVAVPYICVHYDGEDIVYRRIFNQVFFFKFFFFFSNNQNDVYSLATRRRKKKINNSTEQLFYFDHQFVLFVFFFFINSIAPRTRGY